MADAVPATADTKRAQEREYEDRLVARAQSIVEGASLCVYALKIASELTPDQGL